MVRSCVAQQQTGREPHHSLQPFLDWCLQITRPFNIGI